MKLPQLFSRLAEKTVFYNGPVTLRQFEVAVGPKRDTVCTVRKYLECHMRSNIVRYGLIRYFW